MMTAGIKILVCLVLAMDPNTVASEPDGIHSDISRNAELRRQVELQRVSAIDPNQSALAGMLRIAVSQVQSLQWSSDSEVTALAVPAEKTKPSNSKTDKTAQPPASNSEASAAADRETAASQRMSLEEVKKPVNVLATADVLYRAKDYSRALRFYQMAIESGNQADSPDCQWALFQSANCLRHKEPDKAISVYQQLIARYPNSPWTPAALVRQKNLEWFKLNQNAISKNTSSNDPNQQ